MKESQKKKRNGDAVDPNEKVEKALTYLDIKRKFGEEGSIDRLVKFWERKKEEERIKGIIQGKKR